MVWEALEIKSPSLSPFSLLPPRQRLTSSCWQVSVVISWVFLWHSLLYLKFLSLPMHSLLYLNISRKLCRTTLEFLGWSWSREWAVLWCGSARLCWWKGQVIPWISTLCFWSSVERGAAAVVGVVVLRFTWLLGTVGCKSPLLHGLLIYKQFSRHSSVVEADVLSLRNFHGNGATWFNEVMEAESMLLQTGPNFPVLPIPLKCPFSIAQRGGYRWWTWSHWKQ